MSDETIIFECSHIGVAGTTAVHVKKHADGNYEARCGIAIMGATNMDDEQFKACDYNPFHKAFNDNWASGIGTTSDEALAALKADMNKISESLWY